MDRSKLRPITKNLLHDLTAGNETYKLPEFRHLDLNITLKDRNVVRNVFDDHMHEHLEVTSEMSYKQVLIPNEYPTLIEVDGTVPVVTPYDV